METQYLILFKKSTYNVIIRKKCIVLFEIDHYDVLQRYTYFITDF